MRIPHQLTLYLTLLLLCSCAPRNEGHFSPHGTLQGQKLISNFGVVTAPWATEYLAALEHRLTQSIPADKRKRERYQIVLLDTDKAGAFSPGDGKILVTRGLIRELPTEAEFAFVIAHEISHAEIGHTAQLSSDGPALDQQTKHRFELEADEYAVGILAFAAFDPRIAPYAIEHAYSAAGGKRGADESHPGITERTQNIDRYLFEYGDSLPGIVQRRAYVKFRANLTK